MSGGLIEDTINVIVVIPRKKSNKRAQPATLFPQGGEQLGFIPVLQGLV